MHRSTSGAGEGGEGGPSAPLGTHAKYAATSPEGRGGAARGAGVDAATARLARAERFWLQSVARRVLPDQQRLWGCLSWPIGREAGVSVWHSPQVQRAHYAGVQTCGSVWQCPPCNVRITEGRRGELEQAFGVWERAGGVLWFASYTRAHQRRDSLGQVVEEFSAAQRSMRAHRDYKQWAVGVGLVGTVAALETTLLGAHGDHPHRHVGMFLQPPAGVTLEAAAAKLLPIWQAAGERHGFTMNAHGLDMAAGWDAMAEYLAKFGRPPKGRPWGVADELTKSISKRARSAAGLSPFDLLRLAGETGDLAAVRKFQEYAGVFRGKRQLQWSNGLRRRLHELDGAFRLTERSDGELAAERIARGDQCLAAMTEAEWRAVRRLDLRAELLDVADGGDREAVRAFVAAVVAEYEAAGRAG